MHNVISADVMSYVVIHAMNPNNVMGSLHDMCMLVSCNYYMPTITYWTGMQACQPTTTKINCLTFLGTNYQKCKQEHAKKDSHCHAQWEQGQFQ